MNRFYPFYPLLVWLTTCVIATPLSLIIIKDHGDRFVWGVIGYDVTFLLLIFFIVNLIYLLLVYLRIPGILIKISLAAVAISGIWITIFVLYMGNQAGMIYSAAVIISSAFFRIYHKNSWQVALLLYRYPSPWYYTAKPLRLIPKQ